MLFTPAKSVIILLALSTLLPLWGKEYFLMEKGKALCEIVIPANAPENYKYAAKELSKYLALIGKGNAPAIVNKATGKAYPISFKETRDTALKQDGFRITANDKGLLIEHNTSVGALYGAYGILKKYGGIVWLVPGKDGEY